MDNNMERRESGLPQPIRARMVEARRTLGLSQTELGRVVDLTQAHISGIENGKAIPRFDTMVDLARALGFELLLVERAHVPLVEALSRAGASGERPLYAADEANS